MTSIFNLRLLTIILFCVSLMTGCDNPSDSDDETNGGTPGVDGFVYSITVSGNNIYTGGSFLRAGGKLGNANISKWSGTSWTDLDNGVDSFVRTVAVNGSDVYVAGAFENLGTGGSVAALHIARFDGSGWNSLGSGISGNWPEHVNAVAHNGSNLFVGGSFSNAGGVSASNIASWDDSSWSAMGEGVNGIVNVIKIGSDGSVYVGGDFTTAGGVTVNNIARWDGNSWSALGSGVGGAGNFDKPTEVFAIVISGSDVYVGGRFDLNADLGYFLSSVAKWDGSTWNTLARMRHTVIVDTTDNSTDENLSVVTALALNGNTLYAGGDFMFVDRFSSDSLNHMAKYAGGVWETVGGGVTIDESDDFDVFEGIVRAITSKDSDIYIGGRFTNAGDKTVNYIARWDGTNWHSLGGN